MGWGMKVSTVYKWFMSHDQEGRHGKNLKKIFFSGTKSSVNIKGQGIH